MTEIHDWSEIASEYGRSLILGNGASIAVDPVFAYAELLNAARENGLVTSDIDKLFAYVGMPDFELVLTMLWHAHHVNKAMGVTERKTSEAYQQLRQALVATVRKHHVAYTDVIDRLPTLAAHLKNFDTVVSLNYDLIVYWVMMAGNNSYGTWFKDAFINEKFVNEWDWLRRAYNATGTTMVFYPHGNLALATDLNGEERKLTVPSMPLGKNIKLRFRDLLDEITKQWDAAIVTPLFVAEGTSSQKLAAINRSAYLLNVFDKALPALGDAVAIYGWSASDNDRHILEQVLRGSDHLAFSVTRDEDVDSALQWCKQVENRVLAIQLKPKKQINVQFYWADSIGTWGAAAA